MGVAAADRYTVRGAACIIIILMTAVFSPVDGPQRERGDARGLGKFTAAVVERGAAAECCDIGRLLMKTMESLLIKAVHRKSSFFFNLDWTEASLFCLLSLLLFLI